MHASAQEPRREVIKHSAAIQIDNTITLLQRRIWNVLLYHAYSNLRCTEVHCIPLAALVRFLEYHSHDEAYLKEALTALVRCLVTWNLLHKDSEEWGVAALLASVVIKDGLCYYAYSPPLRHRLYHPRMYARLDLGLQNRFASKYAQALWELCTDYLGTSRMQGTTPWIPLAQFRQVMGVGPQAAAQAFKLLNRDVLKPALAEVNRVSDLRVAVARQCRGRRVLALQFTIHRLPKDPLAPVAEPQPLPPVVTLLKDAGLAHRDAWEVWQHGFAGVEESVRPVESDRASEEAFVHYVQEKIHLLKQREQSTTLKNPAGFLLTAIKHNYANPQREQEVAHQEHQRQADAHRKAVHTKEQLLREQDEAWQAVCTQLLAAQPDLLTEALATLRAHKDPVVMFCYELTRSALDNYHTHPAVAGAVHAWLAARFPEQFETIQKPFSDRLAALEARLGALEEPHVLLLAEG